MARRRRSTEEFVGSPPSHLLRVRFKDPQKKDRWDTIGAAWQTRDNPENFTLKLNKGVFLDWRDMEDLTLGLFLNEPFEDE